MTSRQPTGSPFGEDGQLRDEPLPCPFCGSDDIVTDGSIGPAGENYFYATCQGCEASAHPQAWNTRTPPAGQSPEVTGGDGGYRVTADEGNPNNRRIHGPDGQLCKVYGFDQEQVEARAAMIVAALSAPTRQDGEGEEKIRQLVELVAHGSAERPIGSDAWHARIDRLAYEIKPALSQPSVKI